VRAALETVSPLSAPAWDAAKGLFRARERLLRPGAIATDIFFVRTGLLRELYTTDKGVEVTRVFCAEGEISGSLADLLSGAPAMCGIEALEDSDLWTMPYFEVEALARDHVEWLAFVRRNAERLFVRKVRREHQLLTLPAAERYRIFVAELGHLRERIPQHLIASYLGITPVHLSRIRAAESKTRAPRGTATRRRT
jgi:CRP-like cAMP-binding protein